MPKNRTYRKKSTRKQPWTKRNTLTVLISLVTLIAVITAFFVIQGMGAAARHASLNHLKEYVFSDSDLSESIRQNLSGQGIRDDFYVVFLSICNTVERASVFTGTGNTIENAWASAEKQAVAYVKQNKFDLVWAKADVVDSMEWAPTTILNEYVYSTMYQNFFRKGLALDEDFSVAFLESEISGNKLITYYSESDVSAKRIDYEANLLHLNNINYYLKNWRKEGAIPSTPDQIILFTTQGFFCEKDGGVLPLYNEGMNTGRRMLSPGPDHFTPTVLSASEYLYNLIEPDGKFVYGYYPVFDNWMTGYNIVRHASSLWSLINLYRMTHDDTYIKGIDQGMEYLVDCIAYQNADTAYLVEYKVDEIKLGGNGVAIIAMSEYMDVFSSDKYLALVEHLANGILALQDQDTGAYYHVLNYPDFSRKEAVRTVYYDGEATFALARAYSFTGMEKYLDGAQLAVEYFIRNDYTRYRDHWIAYSLHEVTKYIPEPRYFQFALANVEKNLDRIYNQTTSYHTYLELLAISWQTYQRILDNGIAVDGLDAFDAEYFAQALYRRASYMLNSFFYPEYAMYMKVPRDALGTFFVRHDSFRIRIDDIQHFIGGYYYFLKNYDTIRPWLSEAFLEEMHAEGGRFADTPGMDSEIGEDVEASDIEANG